ncbi:unnamed protein product, partial [Mesorhabditis spiculigera]
MVRLPSPYPASTPNASLYVGDLHPDVTESELFEKFSPVGQVVTVRVCRDAVSRKSLGYAYINFKDAAAAEEAMQQLNFEPLRARPMRIMRVNRDPSKRKSTTGNIFISNLDKHVDTRTLHDSFSTYGKVYSCKLAVDNNGNSKGYAFIHFEREQDADAAIADVNAKNVDGSPGRKVRAAKYLSRTSRLREAENSFTNIFVKNFGNELDEAKFKQMFGKYGEIISCKLVRDEFGKSKGFGFVAYKDPESAKRAIAAWNGMSLPGSSLMLHVCRAQTKQERTAELKRQYEAARQAGANIYIKNIGEGIDDKMLYEIFMNCGPITSAKVMTDEKGSSKGFGFVCFEQPESACRAVNKMNNTLFFGKRLYVAVAQRKDDRHSLLASKYMSTQAQQRLAEINAMPKIGGGYFAQSQIARVNNVVPPYQTGPTLITPQYVPLPVYEIQQAPSVGFAGYAQPVQPQYAHPQNRAVVQVGGFNRDSEHPPKVLPQNPASTRPVEQTDNPATEPLDAFCRRVAIALPYVKQGLLGERINHQLRNSMSLTEELARKVTGFLLYGLPVSDLIDMVKDDGAFRRRTDEAIDFLAREAKT